MFTIMQGIMYILLLILAFKQYYSSNDAVVFSISKHEVDFVSFQSNYSLSWIQLVICFVF